MESKFIVTATKTEVAIWTIGEGQFDLALSKNLKDIEEEEGHIVYLKPIVSS